MKGSTPGPDLRACPSVTNLRPSVRLSAVSSESRGTRKVSEGSALPDSRPAVASRPEAEEVRAAASGDLEAFERLYRRHSGRVVAVCLRMCGRRDEAEEMAQEAFVRAWEKLPTFEGRSAFSTWLHRLAVNVVLSAWRSRSRRPEKVTLLDEVAEALPAPQVADRERMDLERAIRELPTGARTIYVLHEVEGFKHREIAERTGLTVGTSKAQLHRARRLLREMLR